MTTGAPAGRAAGGRTWQVSGRTVAGIATAAVLVLWILVNRDRVDVSFLLWSAMVPLWLALAIAGVLGAATGFLLARRRYSGGARKR